MYCASLACMFEKSSRALKIVLSLLPPVNLNLVILLMSKFEYHFRNFYDRDFLVYHTNYSLGLTYLMFVCDFFLFVFIGFYLHNVLPHDFGIRRPFYFLFTKEYWNNGTNEEKIEENKNSENNANKANVYYRKSDSEEKIKSNNRFSLPRFSLFETGNQLLLSGMDQLLITMADEGDTLVTARKPDDNYLKYWCENVCEIENFTPKPLEGASI